MRSKFVALSIILFLAGFLFLWLSPVVLAQGPGQVTWEESLHWVVGPGAAVLAGLIISVLSEYWRNFQELDAKYKVVVYFGLCLLATLTATALAIVTEVWGAWGDIRGTWWPAIWAGIAASGIGTLFHAWAPEPLSRKTSGSEQ